MLNQKTDYQPSQKEIQEIKDVFDLFDIKGNGEVEIKEIKIAMRSLGFEPQEKDLQILSQNGQRNYTDEQTFYDLMFQKIQVTNPNKMIEEAFRLFIGEEGGEYITLKHLQKIVKEIQIDISQEQLQQIMNSADKDRNNKISFQEFKKVIKKTHLFQLIRFQISIIDKIKLFYNQHIYYVVGGNNQKSINFRKFKLFKYNI